MTLEQEIANQLAISLAREIDKDLLDKIMIDVLNSEGWTETKINPAFSRGSVIAEIDWYAQTAEWIHINATGNYKLLSGRWLFENQEDAIMFILRWS